MMIPFRMVVGWWQCSDLSKFQWKHPKSNAGSFHKRSMSLPWKCTGLIQPMTVSNPLRILLLLAWRRIHPSISAAGIRTPPFTNAKDDMDGGVPSKSKRHHNGRLKRTWLPMTCHRTRLIFDSKILENIK